MTNQPSFIDRYHAKTAAAALTPDPAQEAAAQALQALYAQLRGVAPTKKRWFGFGNPKASATHGLYLWGDVGRGKSMLMDLFVETVRHHFTTRRAHFHAFMLNVHQRLFAFRQLGGSDPLPRVIAEIAAENRILCLDEMQVHDVADAMILSRLFSGLLAAGTCVLFTSNRPPEALYQGGIQREQFADFIAMIREKLTIVKLDGATDYRLQQRRAIARSYMFPRNSESDDFLLQTWAKLTDDAPSEPLRIHVQGRVLRVDKQARGVAWMTFAELCMRPLGASDYLELIQQCHTLILQGIPALKAEDRNEARRFVTLIDTLYDHRIKLIATAETPPEGIYAQGDGNFEFTRTVSRLIEMQSEAYWALAKIA